MRTTLPAILALIVLSCGQTSASPGGALPDCEWCGAGEARGSLTSKMTIAPAEEPGEPMVIEGIVFKADGRTPAPDTVLYAYHTNAGGVYPKRGGERGNAGRHGYLRGWLRTDNAGRFTIESTRPGGYPSGGAPAHVHLTAIPPNGEEQSLGEIIFDDDPTVTEQHRNSKWMLVMSLRKGADGVWRGKRDLVLK
jgi:protocatechuate 3,4-dioxygenase beta subunit